MSSRESSASRPARRVRRTGRGRVGRCEALARSPRDLRRPSIVRSVPRAARSSKSLPCSGADDAPSESVRRMGMSTAPPREVVCAHRREQARADRRRHRDRRVQQNEQLVVLERDRVRAPEVATHQQRELAHDDVDPALRQLLPQQRHPRGDCAEHHDGPHVRDRAGQGGQLGGGQLRSEVVGEDGVPRGSEGGSAAFHHGRPPHPRVCCSHRRKLRAAWSAACLNLRAADRVSRGRYDLPRQPGTGICQGNSRRSRCRCWSP